MLRPPVRPFLTRSDGQIAVVFALAAIPLLGFTGMAIDYGLATRLQTKLQAATDATALTLCQANAATTAALLQTQANTTMSGYMGSEVGLTVDPLTVASNPRKITLTTHVTSKTFFSAITGKSGLSLAAMAQCAPPTPKTFEIALVLDTTGSMANSGGSGSKMDALKQAASNFVDYVKSDPAFASDTRISIVPFAASVAVDPVSSATASWVDTGGKSSLHWTNIDKTQANALGFTSRLSIFNALKTISPLWAWGGCFETLPYPQNVQDVAATGGNDSLYVPMFAPDEPGGGTTGSTTWNGNYTFNSYIDDWNGTTSSNCTASPSSFANAEKQACKYQNPRNAKPTGSGGVGLPNGPNFQCLSRPLQRLTSDASTLKTLISSLNAAGSTNIHEGFMWGWRTISPKSVFADGASYSSATTNKVLVLMTDGANSWPDNPYTNYNQTLYFSHGYLTNADGSGPGARLPARYQSVSSTAQQRNALDALTQEACTNAKSTGISVYTIGFSVSSDAIDAQGITLLQNCASLPSQAYVANDSSSLIAAFKSIAKSIGALRLTQ
ncbi:TadE/TadG family type IV pilus assembly protein [Methylobacterium organophilum]|uniref:Putative Flp pilus-assembly TadG-like N-terminal domain-containing protein n=1 Tax=Methylobacterium organophilum TaxID=410 RepID=A0ABQ4T2C7_METOR|nr:pilus assembly protein TadG-related protein [Methylobacterium organophilum]GJE25773.1 hypothetical protein LKMONMHP_0613 [Methylobacterium organophilum]